MLISVLILTLTRITFVKKPNPNPLMIAMNEIKVQTRIPMSVEV